MKKEMNSSVWRCLPVAILALGLAFPAGVEAKKPKPPAPPPATTVTVTGDVIAFRLAPKGEIDGMYLSTGDEVRWAPDQGQFVAAIVFVDSNVTVVGKRHTAPDGRTHINATKVTNNDTGASYVIGSQKGELPPPPPPCDTVAVSGQLVAFKTAPKGEVDGFFLAGGTEVRFPPHEGRNMLWLEIGDVVYVEGCNHVGPKGDAHVRATFISDDDGNSEVIERP
jgi:hypothetical protein